ncbi:hypothetical protein QQ020_27480 [Fulvivirgaceae bacterium BMA12]|uniref:Uncharacterized protein n=1 Tax=Agaribacillus aureus TaxID=3051825 RepID=A0ABT8LF69_9BACT|nr:hypothetical protein [Fulvivirgaceae bacterium BMA12]
MKIYNMTILNYRSGWHLAQQNLALLVLENNFKLNELIKIEASYHLPNK